MSFGENMVYLRKKMQITQEELAEKMYVSRQTISRWETDQVLPDIDTIVKLCDMFNCDMDTLVRGDVSKSNNEKKTELNQNENALEINNEKISKMKKDHKIKDAIISSLFTLITFAYVLIGLITGIWSPTWIMFIAAAGISAVLSIIFNSVYGEDDNYDED